ncbi:MAG TPA: TIGR02757 family protein [Kiritimatiellia bacterium]|nr:TIGR02757 family protein [Kiritimatiellia bacterium]HMO98636.1 TIGR02757 family protein [Kiritimatiellia bacterium]HMP96336.1 TIGR02757 family protein [Kiritimatiellia bacterium]
MRPRRSREHIKEWLDAVYHRYHRPEWIGSDPLQFVYRYQNTHDREIAGLIASTLAYGQVKQIHVSVNAVLERLDHEPHRFLWNHSESVIRRRLTGFRHRWTSAEVMGDLLVGVRRVILDHQTLGAAFLSLDDPALPIENTLVRWIDLLQAGRPVRAKETLARPERNSACKRLHLYLRWMVRHDAVDPGGWSGISPARLRMPVDTHVYRWARSVGFTRRNAVDGKTVQEITGAFKTICPEDPVKYDFSLTRPGIVEKWRPSGIIA